MKALFLVHAITLFCRRAFILIAFSFPLLSHAQNEFRYRVEITGAGNLSGLLKDHLDIRQQSSKHSISREEFQRLAAVTPRQIKDLLATEGYFSPLVTHELVQADDGEWVARYRIDPGPRIEVDRVELKFTGAVATGPHADPERIERLRRRWQLPAGEPFRQETWDAAKAALLKNLLNRDYPAARIENSEAHIDVAQHRAHLSVEVDSGPLFTFGPVIVRGRSRYPLERMEEANPIRRGDPYSQEKLTELQSRLQDSGYFRSAFATIDVDPEHPLETPVHVDVVENELKRLAFGVGISTDAGAHAQAKWLDRGFLGHDWRLESQVRVDRLTQLLGASLYFPERDDGWSPVVGGHFERTDISGEVNDRVRTDARIIGPSKRNEEIWGVSYLAERQRIADVTTHYRRALIASYIYTIRRVDNLMSPTRGLIASAEIDAGPRGLVNSSNLARVVTRANWISPTVNRFQAVVRGQVGRVIGAPREEVPSELLFRTGGDQSVRGYAYNTLGVEENGAIVGGRVTAVASAEIVYHFRPAWGVAVFHDAGNAADSFKELRFRHGTGIGARWRSPIGPVNVDLAYGHEARQVRLHFSIGYGF